MCERHCRESRVPGTLGREDALDDRDPWAEHMPGTQHLSDDLIAEGHKIPVARVQAMHEGKRRKRASGGS